ncbi:MAG TPA: ATP-binding protein [Bryobacteraceae bacterium]|jgi:two-component system NtrC family sensor kinase|nr:ATP-binding protein [Bryobacteraceae bacterium]
MNIHKPVRVGLAAKLAICVVASTAVFFALFGYLNLRVERRQAQDLVLQSAERITDLILRSTHFLMLRNDREALYNVIQELGSEPGIRRIRVFNKEGRITVSTDARELDTVVDKTAEACYGCHAQSQPLAKLNRPDRGRIFTDKHGDRILGVIRPIENSPACSNAACHVHPASQRVLGVVDANLSLAAVDAQIAQHQATLIGLLVVAMVFGSLLAAIFVWTVVYRPVKELIQGTHRVAGGDLNYRLPVRSDDELGDLAASFNKMTEEVAGEQARIEEQVLRKTAELERIHKTLLSSEKMASMGKLAATVAHEINNPLFGILTYARLVLRELLKHDIPARDEMAEHLATIDRESKRCGELVKSLLTFSRQAPSHREPNDLPAVLGRAVALVKHKLELQNIDLQEDLASGLPPVECDANQIQQALLVLLVNASEAMPKGGVLTISAGFDPAAEQVVVRVKDSGSGIPDDVLPRIFDPFFTTKEDQNRTGLGLAVARSIIEQHAGEISVRSTPREGTEFTITLPVAAALAAVGGRIDRGNT